jgi:hypothetical protein
MSVLANEDVAGGPPGQRSTADGRPVAPPRPPLRRPGLSEVRRPPTRARVVAGRYPVATTPCAPRRLPGRWPWLAGLALAACLFVAGLGVLSNGMVERPVPEATTTVPVAAGETLWDLAQRFAPDSDPAAVVARIERLNGVGAASLVPGLPLTVPLQRGPAPSAG